LSELQHSPVERSYPAFLVHYHDHQGRVVHDVLYQGFRALSLYGLQHGVPQLGELGQGLAALLDVEIRPVVKGGNGHVLPSPAGEKHEWNVAMLGPYAFQQIDPVHSRHLIVGHDGV
jgi:hypothetical protein